MNINQSDLSSQYKLMSRLFSQMKGKKINFTNPLEQRYGQKQNSTGEDNVQRLNTQGISGMCIHGKSASDWHQRINISEEGKQKLFDMVKSEFIKNKGVLEGDTTRRTEVISDYLRGIPEKDRLRASWTMNELEAEYRSAFVSAVKQSNPDWDFGKSFDSSVLENITKESAGKDTNQKGSRGVDTYM